MMAISMEGGGQRIQISRIVGFRAFNPVAVSRFMVFHSIEDNTEGAIVLENDWIRIHSTNVADRYSRQMLCNSDCSSGWPAQAHHIFNSLDITSDLEDYVFVEGIQYQLCFLGPIDNLSPGYLFLCPLANLQSQVPTRFRSRACVAYWSLDPSGTEWLNSEDARDLGFPDMKISVEVLGRAWDPDVYVGIRQFQEAKGFDPHTQDAALEAGFPPARVSCERDDLLVHLRANSTRHRYSFDGKRCSESSEQDRFQ
ncbi:hypothetical protein DFH08DRAFT_155073 [Mycena albidolilacea]|uniref:Uncharacterized protein n=1 Tax=Mycena albidolilacea TaxID=1033008 RepID=A0AAD7A1X5_9AGAR|nr:hypothetical protein DFH08DRAFT_155073 [Mycena albidolilacea]